MSTSYVLGHADRELDRLRAQARFLAPITRQFFRDAGLGPGMRVLDVGSGAGDVALLVRDLVGETGEVIGTDKAPAAVATSTGAARARGLTNVRFREGDPGEMEFAQRFDAVVGRYVLPFQPDPASMLRRLAKHLVPGGLLVFHEPDWTYVRSFPPAPLYDRACRWIVETSLRAGTSWNFADEVHAAFARAGLPAPTTRMQTFIAAGPHVGEWLAAVVDIVETLLPAMEKLGTATADEIDLPTLRERLSRDVAANDSVIVGRSEVGIWTRL